MDDDMSSYTEWSVNSQLRGEREAEDGGDPGSTGGEVDEGGASRRRVNVSVSKRSVRVRVSCKKEYGVLARLFQVVERHRLMVDNAGILSFPDSAFDITIGAQMEVDGDTNTEDLVKDINIALGSSN